MITRLPRRSDRGRAHDLSSAEERWEKEGGAPKDGGAMPLHRRSFRMEPEEPFRLDLTAWALRRRPGNAVDRWDETTYRRVHALPDGPVGVSITQASEVNTPSLRVVLTGDRLRRPAEERLRTSIERLLGLGIDLMGFYRMASADRLIEELVARFRGLKPPRFPSVFEGLVNAVACQQLSLEAGLSLLNRLADAHGAAILSKDGTRVHAFPGPDDLARLEPASLRTLGFSLRKASTIIEASRAVAGGSLDLDNLAGFGDDEAVSTLTALRGIGRWSAEYVLLRGLGRLHIFPGDDVGARNNLARWLDLEPSLDYQAVGKAVSRWDPYAGMIYFHLLLDGLVAAGDLDEPRGTNDTGD